MEILNNFRKEKSLSELEETFLVLLPVKEVLAMINDITALQEMDLSLNRAWFLADQIVCKRLMIAAVTVILL
jgi:hypothetical protein